MIGSDPDADGSGESDPDSWSAPSPRCDEQAEHGSEQVVGSVNIYLTVRCDHCGFASGFDWQTPRPDRTDSRRYALAALHDRSSS